MIHKCCGIFIVIYCNCSVWYQVLLVKLSQHTMSTLQITRGGTNRISVSSSLEMKLFALLDIPLNCLEGKLYLAAVMSFMVAMRDISLNGVIPLSLNNNI